MDVSVAHCEDGGDREIEGSHVEGPVVGINEIVHVDPVNVGPTKLRHEDPISVNSIALPKASRHMLQDEEEKSQEQQSLNTNADLESLGNFLHHGAPCLDYFDYSDHLDESDHAVESSDSGDTRDAVDTAHHENEVERNH